MMKTKKHRMTIPFFLVTSGLIACACAFLIALVVCVIGEASQWWWLFLPIAAFATLDGFLFYGFKGRDD